ncbi:hypothetical protein LUZ60_014865 [Juncus effusus]|nr:hypothetical protein LUZ60_014865 [Juncus effusus]
MNNDGAPTHEITPNSKDGDQEMLETSELRHRATPANKDQESSETETISIEREFDQKHVPSWRDQLTVRAFVVSFILSILFSIIVMKLNLTTGIIPSLNVSAGLLGFFFIRTWTSVIERTGLLNRPFTRQENTVIQTCVVAAYDIAFSGGFGSYLLGMSDIIAAQGTQDNDAQNVKNPKLGWMIGFLLLVSFLGLFALVPLRKIMIIDYKLIYPSGTATAHLINGFHTPQGSKLAKKQVKTLSKYFIISFIWGFFQWFYTAGDDCGFDSFPTLGLQAYKNTFFFDFSATYVGVGMICPYIVNVSLVFGAIISWGIMWPLIGTKEGIWYPKGLKSSDLRGLEGYKVFIAISIILGDGLYNFLKVFSRILPALISTLQDQSQTLPIQDKNSNSTTIISFDDQKREKYFMKDQIRRSIALAGYLTMAVLSIITLPHIFPPLKWYYILIIYITAPILAFCNAYGAGLTDWNLASTYGKLFIFIIGAWAGGSHGGVMAGLASCGVMMSIVSTSSDLMQDFRTGYMTLSSPKSMFISQVIGTGMGCVIAPCVFWLFFKAFKDVGVSGSQYPAPYAMIYRNVAVLGVDGFSTLPQHCLVFCYVFFVAAFLVNLLRDLVPNKIRRFIPIPMAMAIPFYLGAYFTIDMCVGSFILFVWECIDKNKAGIFGPAVASGLFCGDGLWSLPQSILALAKVNPPICMKFLSRSVNNKVDTFISS